MKELKLQYFFERMQDVIFLQNLLPELSLNKTIKSAYLNRSGLAFSGFIERFAYQRVQLVGETEINYLQTLEEKDLFARMEDIMKFPIPCFIVAKGLTLPEQMIYVARKNDISIFSTRLTTDEARIKIERFLRLYFAPEITLHGTLMDVYGVGIFLTGKSGIGKSETGLDLIERGHRLIADDSVKIKLWDEKLIGSATKPNIGNFMEVRGIGLVDVQKLYGIEAIRKEKRIDIQVEIMPIEANIEFERVGLADNLTSFLNVEIPIIYLPVTPGKPISLITEIIARNYILKNYGYNAAKAFQEELIKSASTTTNNQRIDTE